MTPKLTERQIERQITDYLALDGWRCIKTDPVSDKSRGKGFGELGMADCLYVRYLLQYDRLGLNGPSFRSSTNTLWIEHKRPGQKPKPHQVKWHEAERARGALTLIAGVDFAPADLDGFMAWYKTSGLMRRRIGGK